MTKLILMLMIANLTQNSMNFDHEDQQTEEVIEFVYWDTFSKTFKETGDYWEAESAALEAENRVKDRINVEEWLADNEDNLSKLNNSET